ncbi:hypothetical protein BJY01DRAFT_248488 [Aspergillus pseudoustus]|uniref:BTB domain-containing protein n=1 Tax=Aspergillus pseudoustus TaxID=1810923 RepID=A0ABR4JUJ6_9EURO
MESLITRIDAAIGDSTEVRNLLMEALALKDAEKYVNHIFQQAALHGDHATYQLILPEVFKHPRKYWLQVGRAIDSAFARKDRAMAEDIVQMVIAQAKYPVKAMAVCGELREPLTAACYTNDATLVTLVLDHIVKTREETMKWPRQGGWPATNMHIESVHNICQKSLLDGLTAAVGNKYDSITAIILPVFLECFPKESHDLIDEVPDSAFNSMSRAQCLKLDPQSQADFVAKRILQRLRRGNQETEAFDLRLPAGEQVFEAHKDVLAYWSPYFATPSKCDWGDEFSAATIAAMIDFAYSGSFKRTTETMDDLKPLAEAARHFMIHRWGLEISLSMLYLRSAEWKADSSD